MAHPDVPVFPQAAVGRLDLLHPFRGVADSHPDAVSLWDADLCVVRRAYPDTVDAIPEALLGLMDEAAEKLAVREPHLADAVPARHDSALDVFPGHPALVALVGHWAPRRVAAGPCTPDEAQSAA